MRQVFHDLSTYSADLFGINSALYELGGLIVMHDASGCNSTYNTHDEPRWYTMDSMVYVSGLTEKDAILGNDQRVIDDMCEVAEREHPSFTAISVSVLPAYMGTDVKGIARLVERRTGVPSFGFKTNGMDSYVPGASMAFRAIAERFCPAETADEYINTRSSRKRSDADSSTDKMPDAGGSASSAFRVNLMGVTPLDFSVNGNAEALEQTILDMGFEIQSNWAMGCTLDRLRTAPLADVSLVVSSTGLSAARYLYDTFGVPYVTGLPCGPSATDALRELLVRSAETGEVLSLFESPEHNRKDPDNSKITIVGEAVHAASIRYYLEYDLGCTGVSVLCPLEMDAGVLRTSDSHAAGEAEIAEYLNEGQAVIADPVYRRVCKPDIIFVDDPHDAYSGRMYHDRGKIFIGRDIDDGYKSCCDQHNSR